MTHIQIERFNTCYHQYNCAHHNISSRWMIDDEIDRMEGIKCCNDFWGIAHINNAQYCKGYKP